MAQIPHNGRRCGVEVGKKGAAGEAQDKTAHSPITMRDAGAGASRSGPIYGLL